MSNTGISGEDFVLWALPVTIAVLVIGVVILNHFAPQIEAWGRKHIKNN